MLQGMQWNVIINTKEIDSRKTLWYNYGNNVFEYIGGNI